MPDRATGSGEGSACASLRRSLAVLGWAARAVASLVVTSGSRDVGLDLWSAVR